MPALFLVTKPYHIQTEIPLVDLLYKYDKWDNGGRYQLLINKSSSAKNDLLNSF